MKNKHLNISLSPIEIHFLILCLDVDLQRAENFFSEQKKKFSKFHSHLERYASQHPYAFSQAQLPSVWAFAQQTEDEFQEWRGVRAVYETISTKLREVIKNAT